MELDPFARPWELAYALMRARQFDAALNEARLRSRAQPDNAALHEALGAAYWNKGMEKEAAQEWEMFFQLAGDTKKARLMHQAVQRGGARAVFEFQLDDDLRKKAAGKYVSPLDARTLRNLRMPEAQRRGALLPRAIVPGTCTLAGADSERSQF